MPTVKRCWRSVTTLAAQIWAGNEIGHDDVLAALGITDGGGPRSLPLSLVASGAAPPHPRASRSMEPLSSRVLGPPTKRANMAARIWHCQIMTLLGAVVRRTGHSRWLWTIELGGLA